jgi:hypothetical protein
MALNLELLMLITAPVNGSPVTLSVTIPLSWANSGADNSMNNDVTSVNRFFDMAAIVWLKNFSLSL